MRILKGYTENGSESFLIPGTYYWTPPFNTVTSICILCIGGGGGCVHPTTGLQYGAGGGALSYSNNVPVVYGSSYKIIVGAGGGLDGSDGGDSSFSILAGSTLVMAKGGKGSVNLGQGGQAISGVGYSRYSGGSGFESTITSASGGGGAAGYTGNGGNGGYGSTPATSGQGGGGGGGGYSADYPASRGAGGGGIGVLGQGADGAAGSSGVYSYRGHAGSGGTGSLHDYTLVKNSTAGLYGGGAGGIGNYEYVIASLPYGGRGAVRIIWGALRSFPSTGTGEY